LKSDVLIIGGGIAGLYAGYKLKKDFQDLNVTICEKENEIGGRIKTTYTENGDNIELGAMRIPGKHHKTIKLCSELGITLVPFAQSQSTTKNYIYDKGAIIQNSTNYNKLFWAAMYKYAEYTEENQDTCTLKVIEKLKLNGKDIYSISFRDFITEVIADDQSRNLFWTLIGYDHYKDCQVSAISVLMTDSGNENHTNFYQPKKGMSTMTDSLCQEYKKLGGELLLDCRVIDISQVDGIYKLRTSRSININCKILCIAIPCTRMKELFQQSNLKLGELETYLQGLGTYSSIKSFLIYKSNWWKQLSHANVGLFRTNLSNRQGHYNPSPDSKAENILLAQYKNNNVCLTNPSTREGSIVEIKRDLDLIHEMITPEPIEFREYDWARNIDNMAGHYWRPGADCKSTIHHAINKSTNLYCIGEGISMIHGWIEGSIESADMFLMRIKG
tara:strand:- start:2542 stop:3873 length:1332 start_codon:yes stop_codon:yes gene_type:complete